MILDFYQISLNFFNKCCKNCLDLIKTIELSFQWLVSVLFINISKNYDIWKIYLTFQLLQTFRDRLSKYSISD